MTSTMLFRRFMRLSLASHNTRQSEFMKCERTFYTTPLLQAEPVKKKKRIDTQAVIQREIKRRNKIEKSIRKLETKGRTLKPIEEISGNRDFIKTLDKRKREKEPISFEENERRALMMKTWAKFKCKQYSQEVLAIDRAAEAREQALTELRKVSEDLYLAALKKDDDLIPFTRRGPTRTPPIEGYEPPDGDIANATKLFDGEEPSKLKLE